MLNVNEEKNDDRRRNYMREYRARRKEEEKARKLAELSLIKKEETQEDVDFESFVPFSTIVVTERIMTPLDLVRENCKRLHSPPRDSKLGFGYNVEKKLREKGLQPSESNTNVYSVTTDQKEPAPSKTLQIGYVIPQSGVPDSALIVPCPVSSKDSSTVRIQELNGVQAIQQVVLPQATVPGQPLVLPGPSATSTSLQIGNMSRLLSIPNMVVPQITIPGQSYIPSGTSTTPNALQIGNLGQVLLIENKDVSNGSVAGPPVVLMNGKVLNGKIVDPSYQDYDDLIPTSVTIGDKKKFLDVKSFNKPEYRQPSEACEENDKKDNIDLGEIVLNDVKFNEPPQVLDEKISEPQNQGHFIGIKQENDPENCLNNNEPNEIFIKKEQLDFEDEIPSHVQFKAEKSDLNTSIIVKEDGEVKNEEDVAG